MTRSRGQSLAEFALIIPLLLAMVIGVLDLGRMVWAMDSVSNAAREAARFAIVHGGSPGTDCPVGPPSPETNVPSPSSACQFPSPSTQSIKNVAQDKAVAAGGNLTVSVCYGETCSGDAHQTGVNNSRGTPVTVRVDASLALVVPSLLCLGNMDSCAFGSFVVSGESTMLVNN
jgi:hypothetical protein